LAVDGEGKIARRVADGDGDGVGLSTARLPYPAHAASITNIVAVMPALEAIP
jgi:hypothetical protein